MRSFILGSGRVLTKGVDLFHAFIHFSPNINPHRVTCQPRRVLSKPFVRGMKRKATDSGTDSKAKRQREPQADYCDVTPRKDDHGNAIWPASEQSIYRTRAFLKEW